MQIMSELVSNGVQTYQFPVDDETVADLNSTMNVSMVATLWSPLRFLDGTVLLLEFLGMVWLWLVWLCWMFVVF